MGDEHPETIYFEGYDQAQKIGQGGMASVWKARQISLDRWVAIKVLFPEQTKSDEEIDRFQSEARIAARMNHPGIVQVYDAFYRNDRFCYVMELVDGYTLGSWIKTGGIIEESKCLFVAGGVAEALSYAWTKQMLVHCDLKPENIMIDSDGTVKVTDFGLSKSILSLQSRRHVENPEFIFGTPAYISPEQAVGETNLTINSDMYSLGATLFHMATGKRLFDNLKPDPMMEAQVNEQYADPFELNPDLSPFFCDFLERLLCKKPSDRYSSWEEVLDEINSLRNGLPLQYGHINPIRTVSSVTCSSARSYVRSSLMKRMVDAGICDGRGRPPNPTTPRALAQNENPVSLLGSTIPLNVEEHDLTSGQADSEQHSDFIIGNRGRTIARWTAISAGAIAMLLMFVLAVSWAKAERHRKEARELREELKEIEHFYRIRPYEYTAAIKKCDALLSKLPYASHKELKQDVIEKRRKVAEELASETEKVMKELRISAKPFMEAGQYSRAASMVQAYDGVLAEETRAERAKLAATYRQLDEPR